MIDIHFSNNFQYSSGCEIPQLVSLYLLLWRTVLFTDDKLQAKVNGAAQYLSVLLSFISSKSNSVYACQSASELSVKYVGIDHHISRSAGLLNSLKNSSNKTDPSGWLSVLITDCTTL